MIPISVYLFPRIKWEERGYHLLHCKPGVTSRRSWHNTADTELRTSGCKVQVREVWRVSRALPLEAEARSPLPSDLGSGAPARHHSHQLTCVQFVTLSPSSWRSDPAAARVEWMSHFRKPRKRLSMKQSCRGQSGRRVRVDTSTEWMMRATVYSTESDQACKHWT